jgi:hypothetical protein
MHLQEEQGQLQQCGDAFSQQSHFADVHGDMTHDVQCLSFERRNLISHIHHPNQIGWLEFSCQIGVQQVAENYETLGRHQIFS